MSTLRQAERKLIGSLLAEARQAAGLTQREVAGRLGHPQEWLSRVETGLQHCRFDDFVALSRIVGLDSLTLCARYLEVQVAHEQVSRKRWGASP